MPLKHKSIRMIIFRHILKKCCNYYSSILTTEQNKGNISKIIQIYRIVLEKSIIKLEKRKVILMLMRPSL